MPGARQLCKISSAIANAQQLCGGSDNGTHNCTPGFDEVVGEAVVDNEDKMRYDSAVSSRQHCHPSLAVLHRDRPSHEWAAKNQQSRPSLSYTATQRRESTIVKANLTTEGHLTALSVVMTSITLQAS